MQRKGLVFLAVAVLLTGIMAVSPLAAQDDSTENQGVLLAVLEGYLNAFSGNADAVSQFLTEDVVRHHLRGPNMDTGELAEQSGIGELADMAAGFQAAYPGVTFSVPYSVERDNYIWCTNSSTELPDTDGRVINVVLVARFSEGKMAEIWVADDELAMLSLLDALPAMAE